MTDQSTTRDRLMSALEESDQRRRIGRAERIEWLSLHESQPSVMFERTETMRILQEARETFVDGHFVASLLLATSFIEHTLAEELQLLQHAKGSLSFVEALKLASAHKVFPEDWIIRAEALRLKRNPFAHLKEAGNKHTMGARYRELRMHPVAMLESDAKDALDLMYNLFVATLREAAP